jgi:hypothetical protein
MQEPTNDELEVLTQSATPDEELAENSGEKEVSSADTVVAGTAFCQQEFAELRQEILINTEETRRMERFCLVAAAVVFSWVATEAPKSVDNSNIYFAAFLPSVLVAFGWLKCSAMERTISKIGAYIYKVEERLSPQGEGWEHYYKDNHSANSLSPEGASAFFWPLLLAATLVGAFVLTRDSFLGIWFVNLIGFEEIGN